MRRAAKVDDNQPEIVAAFRSLGCSVQPLHAVGQGVPDLLIGIAGHNYLCEVKDGAKVKSARKLTDDQVLWHGRWLGQVDVVETIDDVIAFVKAKRAAQAMTK